MELLPALMISSLSGAQFVSDAPDTKGRSKGNNSASKGISEKEHLFATAGAKGAIKVWSSLKGKCIAEQELPGHLEEGSQLTALETCQSGMLMSATEDSRLTLVNIAASSQPSSL